MRTLRTILSVFCCLLAPLTAFAQVLPAASPQNLAASLATANIPAHRVYLSVSAETIALPQGSDMPPNSATLTTIIDTYQRSVRAFGAVTAIAPSTMFVLNPHPDNPDLYAGMGSNQAFKLLAASLNAAQWAELTGEGGIGVSDLIDDNQRRLFQTLFPGETLKISVPLPTADAPDGMIDLSSELPQARLRLTQNVQISLPMKGSQESYGSVGRDPPAYRLMEDYTPPDRRYGVMENTNLPNVLKKGQLNWNLPSLQALVTVSGLKTVGDLIRRVAQVSHLELYADKRYEGKSLTVLGADCGSVPAADLLRALAFCLTGVFRQVGPAYVLTNEVIGTEARRAVIKQFQTEAAGHQQQQIDKASDLLATKYSARDLTAFDDPLALTPDEWKIAPEGDVPIPSMLGVMLPLSQLTSAQQENVRQQAAKQVQDAQTNPGNSVPDLDKKIKLQFYPVVQILVPSLRSPVATSFTDNEFFDGSFKLQTELLRHMQKNPSVSDPPQSIPLSLAQAMALTPHRAVRLQPTSPAELLSEIGAMKRLGFNELWLTVFSQGQFQTTLTDGSDLLTLALRKTCGTGIRVYAVMDLFLWGTDAPPDAVDVDPFGETSAQAEARLKQEDLDRVQYFGGVPRTFKPISGLIVTPLNRDVSAQILTVVKNIARRPGLAGIVWRDTAPGGYDNERDSQYDGHQPDLGYNLTARLAFLRQEHADPIDISKTRMMAPMGSFSEHLNGFEVSVNAGTYSDPQTSIPNFNNETQDAHLSIAWDKFRRDADITLMRVLDTAVKNTSPDLSVFVQQRHSDFSQDWYGSWDSSTAPLPEWKITSRDDRNTYQVDHMAKEESPSALIGLSPENAHNISGLASALSDNLKDSTWDGFVWDLTPLKSSALSALGQPAKTKQKTRKP